MDIFEYWEVLKREARLFWGIVLAALMLAMVWQVNQSPVFGGTLLVNIGRTAVPTIEGQDANEYAYDNFYRLQADERFGDTVVRWLANPRVVSDIYQEAGMNPDALSEQALVHVFDARRLSSQVVEVRFRTKTSGEVGEVATALVSVVNQYTATLDQSGQSWFRVVGSDPVVRDARVTLWWALAVAGLVSVFVAFWAVILYDYWKRRQKELSTLTSQAHS